MRTLLRRLTRQLPDSLYVFLKNYNFKLQGQDIRLKKLGVHIIAIEKGESWFSHRKRVHLYSGGLMRRGESIGKSYLLSEITFRSGDLIIDCGANMGDLLLFFKTISLSVEYVGFEPNPIDYECLRKNLTPSGKANNLALWNSTSEMIFYVDTDSASSSLIEPPFYTEKLRVPAARLDSLDFSKRIKLFKVEGEGAEPEILEGAKGLFSSIEYIAVDAGPERGINQTPTREDVLKVLANSDFELIMENPFHRKTLLFRNKKLS
jgi:FkbM family methyltransferase